MTLAGYRKHLASQAAPLPLTAAEEELRQIKLNEVRTHTLTHTGHVGVVSQPPSPKPRSSQSEIMQLVTS